MAQWIDIEQERPPVGEMVLAAVTTRRGKPYMRVDILQADGTWSTHWPDDFVVTHWLKVPSLPDPE